MGAGGLVADPTQAGVDFSVASWVRPTVWLHYDPGRHSAQDLGITPDPGTVPAFARSLRAYQAVETTARARDGSPVPLALISRRNAARRHAPPVLLIGTTATGAGSAPEFAPSMQPWLDAGGVLAVARVRSGSDCSSDFVDSAQTLIARRITDSAHLAGSGAGPLAIPIGDSMAGRPDLFRAALIQSDGHATSRTHPAAGGSANIPAVLLAGAQEDPAAALRQLAGIADRLRQAEAPIAPAQRRPVLLRIEAGEAAAADQQAFLLWQFRARRASSRAPGEARRRLNVIAARQAAF